MIVITGRLSNLVVLDIDPRHGGDESLKDWEAQHGPLPETVRCLTGGGGAHYYFAYPPTLEVRNTTAVLPGVDRRGEGGYVLAPPSLHASGVPYRWEIGQGPEEIAVAAVPDTHRALFEEGQTRAPTTGALDLEALTEGRLRIAEGTRNDRLTRIAGHYVGEGRPEWEVRQLLHGINVQACDPPLPEQEIDHLVASICGREARRHAMAAQVSRRLNGEQDEADLTTEDRLGMAESLWREVAVPGITDWIALRTSKGMEYLLVTPENEVSLGSDLLDYPRIRRVLLNELEILAPPSKQMAGRWDHRALLLRQLAREVQVEPARAEERIHDWIEAFVQQYGAHEVPREQRRDALASGAILVDGILHLRPYRLTLFIEAYFGERMDTTQMRKLLRATGWEDTKVSVFDPRSKQESTTSAWKKPG